MRPYDKGEKDEQTDYDRGTAQGRRDALAELKAVYKESRECAKVCFAFEQTRDGREKFLGMVKAYGECIQEIESREGQGDEGQDN